MSTMEVGKRGEFVVLAELLRRGARVYLPMVDVEGIDAIVRRLDGSYIELQVKTVASPRSSRWFQVTNLKARPNFFIIGVALREQEVWVIPSPVFAEYATISQTNRGAKIYDLDLNGGARKLGAPLKDVLAEYRNAWELITGPFEAALRRPPDEAAFAEDWDSVEDSVYDAL